MPTFEIVVENDHGLKDILVEEHGSVEEARSALQGGRVEPNSGLLATYNVIRIKEIISSEYDVKEHRRISLRDDNIAEAKKRGDYSDLSVEELMFAAESIIITTSHLVSGREIEKEIDIITAETVFGMNIFRDFFAGIRDIVGGRSAATQKVLRDARKTALAELKREALTVGADAVIAIDLDYQEISGGGKLGMLMIVASGTAVKLKPAKC